MRRPDMAGKISFLRRMRRTIGYAGRYLFPCPLSAGLSPLFSSALVTFFPSSPHTVISFFLCPDQPLSLLSGNRRFFLLYRKLSLVRHRFDRSTLPFLRSFFASLFLRRTAFLLLAPYSLSPFSFPFPALVTSFPPLLRPPLSALFSAHLHRPLFRLFRSLPVTQKT